MMLALIVYPYPGASLRISMLLACAATLILSIVWGCVMAPRLARRFGHELFWRVLGMAFLVMGLAVTAAHAGPPAVVNPCETCQALWPAWMCWLDCVLF